MDRRSGGGRPRSDGTATSTSDRGPSIPRDAVFAAVGDEQRRAVLRLLDRSDETTMEMGALADQVAERVRDGEPPIDHRRRVRTELHHLHLPKLEDCGMITYDVETGQVRCVNDELGQELLALIAAYEARR